MYQCLWRFLTGPVPYAALAWSHHAGIWALLTSATWQRPGCISLQIMCSDIAYKSFGLIGHVVRQSEIAKQDELIRMGVVTMSLKYLVLLSSTRRTSSSLCWIKECNEGMAFKYGLSLPPLVMLLSLELHKRSFVELVTIVN